MNSFRTPFAFLLFFLALGALDFFPAQAHAADPGVIRNLILEPMKWELTDIDNAEKEVQRLAERQVERWAAWKMLFERVPAFIEESRARLIEEHDRIKAWDDVARGAYPSLKLPDGTVRFPEWGADGRSDEKAMEATIAYDQKRIAEELDAWKKGDVMIFFPAFPETTLNGLQNTLKDWARRIDEFKTLMARGDYRVAGPAWFFGSATRNDLGNMRKEAEKRIREKEDDFRAHPERAALKEIGLGSAADIDREIENTGRSLKEAQEQFEKKEFRLDRWGVVSSRQDVEKRISEWEKEIGDRKKTLEDGSFKAWFPGMGSRSRTELEQENRNLQGRIGDIDAILKRDEYKVDLYYMGLNDGKAVKNILATSKDAGMRAAAADGLRRIPLAAAMHKRFFELMIQRNNQYIAAIPRLSPPAFIRPELEIEQAKEMLAEFDREWSLVKARCERRLDWLRRCKNSL